MITIRKNHFGTGTARWAEKDGQMLATIHKHDKWLKLPGDWSVNWMSGRVDWHNSYQEARDNALKGN